MLHYSPVTGGILRTVENLCVIDEFVFVLLRWSRKLIVFYLLGCAEMLSIFSKKMWQFESRRVLTN